jgi:glycosyltransferase involved in cell wall biosynthesis
VSHKIAILLNSAWNAYNFRKGLIQTLLAKGDEVVVIAPRDEYTDRLISWGIRFVDIRLEGTGLNPLDDWRYKQTLVRLMKSEKPDVVLSFTIKPNIYGAMAAYALRIPIICNVSGLGTTFLWKGWLQRMAVALYNWGFRRANFIFFQNNDDRTLFLEHVRVNQAKTGLLPGSGIDLNTFKAEPPSFQSPLKFLMISRLIVEKGVNEFVTAAQSIDLSKAHFTLIGKYDPAHKRSISAEDFQMLLASGIDYLDHQDDVKAMIAQADAVILPSYREGTPRTLLEAAAMCRPLIATDVPGCREVAQDGVNGFLCKAEDATSLAQKINLFLALSPTEQLAMAHASRRLVEVRFDEKIVIGEYLRMISRLVT